MLIYSPSSSDNNLLPFASSADPVHLLFSDSHSDQDAIPGVWIYTFLGAGVESGSPHSHLPLRNGAGSPHNWKLNMLPTEKRRAEQ